MPVFIEPNCVAPGWIQSQIDLSSTPLPAVAFALQSLPTANLQTYGSIRDASLRIAKAIKETIPEDADWSIDIFCPWDVREVSSGRAKLIREHVLDLIRKRVQHLSENRPGMMELEPKNWFVQVGLLDGERLAMSILPPKDHKQFRRLIWPLRGGAVTIPRDPNPPSRAYAKLLEAMMLMRETIADGNTCVDLGASPGGWTHVLLNMGAHVTAVDRSPLRDDLMKHPRCTFVRGDAFTFVPEKSFDWMVYDVAAYPQRTIQLLEQWLNLRWCRRAIVTVKFTGSDYVDTLRNLKAMLDNVGCEYRIRRLLANKNEIAVMAGW